MRRLVLTALCVSAASAEAQIAAALRGRVLDPSGAVVVNASVDLTEVETGTRLHTVSSGTGDYFFANLAPGAYAVTIDARGFRKLDRRGLTVMIGQTVTADLALSVGAEQTVTVESEGSPLQVGTSDVETNIAGTTLLALPLNSRNFVQLAALAPGVSLPPGTLLPRINGGRPRTNEYLYDGISALQPEPGQVAFFPILDDIEEFTVEANNVSAEFGRFNGGVVNVATRAGSNRLHGSLFEFFRNEALNARNYFATPAPARKPEYRRNLFGATLGGPLLRDRVFGFADYQGVQALIGRTVTSTIPTLNERAGIFTGVAKIYDPATTQTVGGKYIRTEFVNDTILSGFDPIAKVLLARLPVPTTTGAANNYTRTANDTDHQNQFDVRLDGSFRQVDRAFGRYSCFSDVEKPVTPLPDGSGASTGSVIGTGAVVGLSRVLGQQAVFNESHTFTPHLLNDFRLGYTRRGNGIAGPVLGTTASAALGIPGIPTNAAFSNALPLFTFTGFQQLGPSAGTFSQYQTAVWQVVDSVVWTRSRHVFRFGGDLRFYQLNTIAPPNPTGLFAFTTTGTDTQTATSSGASGTSGGNAIASFLLGQVDTFAIDLQTARLRPRDHIQEYFVQDDVRATSRLSLNLGLRYTLHAPSTEKNNQGAVFNLGSQQLDFLGQNGFPQSARRLHYTSLAPRLGFSYLLTPKTVARGGFGIVFIDQSGITTPFTAPQFPFIQSVTQRTQDSVNAAFVLAAGPTVAPIPLTPAAGLGQSVYTANRAAGSGYVEQWNLAVERALTANLSLQVAYVGSHIVHVGIPDSNLNQLSAAQLAQGLTNPASLTGQVTNPFYGQIPVSSSIGGKTVAAAQLLKPFPRFQNVATYRNNSGTASYNAVEARLQQRLSRGLFLLVSFTHSKLIDDASSVFSSTVLSSPNSSSLVAADTFRPWLERDSSSGDMPNVTSASVVYRLPAGRGHRVASTGIANAALGGWSLNALVTAQSGMPVTVTQTTNSNAFAGFALQRPNVAGNPSLNGDSRSPLRFFNTAAFATAPQFTLGNASRNPVRGPAYRDFDVALVKVTSLAQKTLLEFRAEVFDVTNTPAFAQPNGSFGSAAFGTITATTTDPRVVQFALRLSR